MQEWKQKYEFIAATSNQAYSIFCGFCSKEFDDMSENLQDSMTPTNFTSVFVQTRDSWRKKDSSGQQKQLPAF